MDEKMFNILKKNKFRNNIEIRPVKIYKEENLFYLKSSDKQNYVKHRLNQMKESFKEVLNITEFHSINHQSHISFYTIGMVLIHTSTKLTNDSLYVVSNIDDSNDVLVKLNVKYLKKYSFFPGQIIVIFGKNPNGNEIIAEEIHCIPTISYSSAVEDEENLYSKNYENGPISVCCFSGPFWNESTKFESLDLILEKIYDVLILFGPFVDSKMTAKYESSPQEIFTDEILVRIEKYVRKGMNLKVILIPHPEDVFTVGIFPHSFTFLNDKKFDDRILMFSNPSLFYVNEFLFGLSTSDILLSLSSEELFCNQENEKADKCSDMLFCNDRISRICHHLIYQKSFVPVFPSKSPICYEKHNYLDMDVSPDFLIQCSKLITFEKQIGPTVVCNIGSQSTPDNKHYIEISLKSAKESNGKRYDISFLNLKNKS
ncbi:subunit B of DNA polymerase alpha-primase complex [Hamiltosporidium tvaerminnensis]|uniref:DNA polymerase alpha subunit B n=1 Tax=Hamiltosporidium tvaerminnensis TaxID=1176355 RepID=A0A4Q9L8G1_9MICR|nr:subunit B of DNA polymerase alpha-primase complex [Hamiltosporidium tvaerminnensis]